MPFWCLAKENLVAHKKYQEPESDNLKMGADCFTGEDTWYNDLLGIILGKVSSPQFCNFRLKHVIQSLGVIWAPRLTHSRRSFKKLGAHNTPNNPSNAEGTYAQRTKTQRFCENHLNPIMLVFIGKLSLSTLR